jgi:hypothetical protein
MKSLKWTPLLVALAVIVLAARIATATERPGAIALGPGSELWIEGTSTMHSFENHSHAVELEVALDSAAARPAGVQELASLIAAGSVRELRLRVPVASLKSEKEGLDKNLRKTMDAEHYPDVRFAMTRYAAKAAGGDTLALHAMGALTIKAQTRDAALDARAWPAAQGVWLDGTQVLKMTDYGITPPTMMLGAIKVGNAITVRYHLLLVPGAAAANDSPASAR